jgi:hypothetical protein
MYRRWRHFVTSIHKNKFPEDSGCYKVWQRVSLRNFVARLARSVSRYEISVCKTREKRVSLLNFNSRVLRESRGNFGSKKRVSLLARISKSDSRVNPSCKTVTVHSYLLYLGEGGRGASDSFKGNSEPTLHIFGHLLIHMYHSVDFNVYRMQQLVLNFIYQRFISNFLKVSSLKISTKNIWFS